MDRKVRQRVMRSFIAALLQSELSLEELRELSFDVSSGAFGSDLSKLLDETIFTLRGRGPYESKVAPETIEDSVIAIIQKRRLSKKAVLDLMASTNSRKAFKEPALTGSMRELVERFLRTASNNEVTKFLNLLDASETTEAYLRGIIRRD
jgi:hypothetical protein